MLVLDESGSMSLESPSRMERLKVAAGDFISTAENGIELGLVSYATDAEVGSGRANVPIAALGAEVGVDTPLVRRLVELIHEVEEGRKPQGWETLDALR